MKDSKLTAWLRLLLVPCLLIVFGLILLVNPDSASRLIASVLGWVLMAVGILYAISAITGSRQHGAVSSVAKKNGTVAVVCIILGAFLTARPLALAAFIGCIVGAALLLQGLAQLRTGRSTSAILTVVAGALLILLPMTTSRLLFRGCGVVVLVFGVLTLLGNLRGNGRSSGDSTIIDL